MSFVLANLSGQSLPTITEKAVKTGQDFHLGAPLIVVSGKYEEVAADPTVIDAIAVSGFGPDTGNIANRLGTRGFPPGRCQAIDITGQPSRRFTCEVDGDQDEIDDLVEGHNYGIVRGASDHIWRLDSTETTATVVKLISKEWNSMLSYDVTIESVQQTIVKGRNRVLVEFLTGSDVGAES